MKGPGGMLHCLICKVRGTLSQGNEYGRSKRCYVAHIYGNHPVNPQLTISSFLCQAIRDVCFFFWR
jgi:hypothetical protein